MSLSKKVGKNQLANLQEENAELRQMIVELVRMAVASEDAIEALEAGKSVDYLDNLKKSYENIRTYFGVEADGESEETQA